MGQKLQAPDLPFHLYSEPETPGSLQWFRRCRFQAFRFTGQKLQVAGFLFHLYSGSQTRGCRPSVSLLQWARDSRFQTYRFSQSAILRWARLQAPVPRHRPFTYTVVRIAAQQRARGLRDKRARSIRRFLKSVAEQMNTRQKVCSFRPQRCQGLQVSGCQCHLYSGPKSPSSSLSVSPPQWARDSISRPSVTLYKVPDLDSKLLFISTLPGSMPSVSPRVCQRCQVSFNLSVPSDSEHAVAGQSRLRRRRGAGAGSLCRL